MVPNFRDQEPRLEGSKTKAFCPETNNETKTLKLSLETSRYQHMSLENYCTSLVNSTLLEQKFSEDHV